MSGETLFVFALLGVTIVAFVSDWLRLDIIALLVVLILMISGVLTPAQSLAGFSDAIVIMIAGLFVVGEGLYRTGVAFAIGQWVIALAGRSESRVLVLLMLVVAGLSAFMSSTGAVAIFIPIVLVMAEKVGVAPARLLMPVACASLIGGMLTLIGTPPNLVVANELSRQGMEPFGFFAFTPIGLLILVVGVAYMLFAGRRLLGNAGHGATGSREGRVTLRDLAEGYGLEDQFHRLRVGAKSPLKGRTVSQARLRTRFDVTVVGMANPDREVRTIAPALAHSEFAPGLVLYAVGSDAAIAELCRVEHLEPLEITEETAGIVARDLGLVEVLITPRSALIGKSLIDAKFRHRYGLNGLAVLRDGVAITDRVGDIPLAFGDSLLIGGGWKQIRMLQGNKADFLPLTLPSELDEVAPTRDRAAYAIGAVLVMLVLMTLGVVPGVTAVLIAALAMVLTGCVGMKDAYASINWESLVLIAGMLPMATALQETGGIHLIVEGLVSSIGALGPTAMMAGLFVLTSIFSQFISNTATTVLVAPIAIGAAEGLSVSPLPFLMTVALAASTAFSTPVASPVNTLVLGPGGYRFADFVRVGVPLQLLCMVVTLLTVPLLFPL